ncbi:MAG TPA: Holliday junction resolvase-like protein [bacterium]|nr:Holliday junction resolvase-like protein [bacterium]
MSQKQEAAQLVATLKSGGFRAECPGCQETFKLKDASLFVGDDFSKEALAVYDQRLAEIKQHKAALKELERSISAKSETGARTTNLGFIYERLAPTLKGFKLDPNDCRSLFDPIDYVVFNGLSKTGRVDSIVFMDVKSGEARLSKKQKAIQNLVEASKVTFQTYEAAK